MDGPLQIRVQAELVTGHVSCQTQSILQLLPEIQKYHEIRIFLFLPDFNFQKKKGFHGKKKSSQSEEKLKGQEENDE